jgi:hypothetical protein
MSQLSSRQRNIQNLVYTTIPVLDVCGIVSQYVFPCAFKMKLVRQTKLNFFLQMKGKAIGFVDGSHVVIDQDRLFNLQTGKKMEFNVWGEVLGFVNGNLWIVMWPVIDGHYDDCKTKIFRFKGADPSVRLSHLKAEWMEAPDCQDPKLIGCVDHDAFFVTNKSILTVSSETGTKINQVPYESEICSMVVTNEQSVIYWKSIDSSVTQLCSVDLSGRNRQELIVDMPTDLLDPNMSYTLNVVSGDEQEEIWAICVDPKPDILVFSVSTLKLLRTKKRDAKLPDRMSFIEIENTLYGFKPDYKNIFTEVSVFE